MPPALQNSSAILSRRPASGPSDSSLLRAVPASPADCTETGPCGNRGGRFPEARRRRLARDLFLEGLKQALVTGPVADAPPLPSLLGRHLAAIADARFDERGGAIPHGA